MCMSSTLLGTSRISDADEDCRAQGDRAAEGAGAEGAGAEGAHSSGAAACAATAAKAASHAGYRYAPWLILLAPVALSTCSMDILQALTLCSAAIIETMRDCMSVKVHRAVLQAAATWCPPPGAFQSLPPAQLGRRRLCTYKAPLHPSRSMPTSTRSWQHRLARRCRRLQCRSSCTPGQPPCLRSLPSIFLLSRLQASLHSRSGVCLLTPSSLLPL